MRENLITWSVANWITIFLMAVLGYAVFAAITSMMKSRSSVTISTGT